MNGIRKSLPGKQDRFDLRATHLFRIRDLSSRQPRHGEAEDDTDASVATDEFARELQQHYRRWPHIAASCIKQPGPDGAWVIRLVSALSMATVQGSLLELLAHLNHALAEGDPHGKRFELQELSNQASEVALHAPTPQRLQ